MRILTYKRTHVGDPDAAGRFGVDDRMGRVRILSFDAVIGVGGVGREARSFGIDGKINWVGIGPTKRPQSDRRGDVVTFREFWLLEETGPALEELAPRLARRIYGTRVRFLLTGYSAEEQAEAESILEWARAQPGTP
jgi:hypothetical protein